MLTFSERYLRPEAVQADAVRMRNQLLALFDRELQDFQQRDIADDLKLRTGAVIPRSVNGYKWNSFFQEGELRDLLDLVTVTYHYLFLVRRVSDAQNFISSVQSIFDQQNMQYRVDENGGVLLRVDEAFETGRSSVLAGLDSPRYQGVRIEFEGAFRALAAQNPNGKQAIRGIFEACEVVFKLMCPAAQRLAAQQLGQHLSPFLAQHYAEDRPAAQAAEKLVQGFTDWAASAQFYRHGQGQEEPNQPPLEVAVMILSSGASYLRWLVHLDQAKLGAGG